MSQPVLIVEDDPQLGATMVTMLELLGYEPTLTTGVREAMAKLEETQDFHAIISDYSLGDGHGTEVMRHCVNSDDLSACLLIITSGYDRSTFEGELVGLERVEWITKPYPIALIKEKLEE